jgi:protocatechuate 3,4-dioxygenase alpha subunit
MSLQTTASQTIGPYLHIGLTWLVTDNLVAPGVDGTPISLAGRITDGDGKPVNDALVEIWQANSHGRYAHPDDTRDGPLESAWQGFGRVPTDEDGRFQFTTVKPGRVPAPGGGLPAPHIHVTIDLRGLPKHRLTRIYFDGDPANAQDTVLNSVPAERRATLLARPANGNAQALTWDVRLQGEGETVFFAY